jgi:uncharacterized protein (DUF433 family)
MHERFESKPGVMGGKLCIKGTRVPLANIVDVMDAGWDDETVLEQFPSLTAEDVRAARGYWRAHHGRR